MRRFLFSLHFLGIFTFPLLIFSLTLGFLQPAYASISDWQKGLTLRLNNQLQIDTLNSLVDLSETNADWVAITPGWLTSSDTSSDVYRKPGTPTDEILIYSINKAHELGLKVMLKPHLDINGGRWRGFLMPADTNAFFNNYQSMIMQYAQLAQNTGVEQLSIGAELVQISGNPANEGRWRELISSIRSVYSGKLTYSANADYGSFNETLLPFWDALDVVGLSMYRNLTDKSNPTQSDFLAGWTRIDNDFVQPLLKYGKPIIFTEIGYRSVDLAALRPWDYSTSSPINLEIQKSLYTAMFEYWKDKSYFHGVHIWDWFIGPNAGGSLDSGYTPQKKPAEEVLTSYFSSTPSGNPVDLINSIVPSEYLIKKINLGDPIYSDRAYMTKQLPVYIQDQAYIQTKNSDKYNKSSEFLKFNLNRPAFVIVAFDVRATALPDWLKDWQMLPDQIYTTDVSYKLYKKAFFTGQVTLGGNAVPSMSGAGSNYFVLISEDAIDLPLPSPTPTPSEIKKELVIHEPKNEGYVTGEKKLKAYIPKLDLNTYRATYEVDGRGQINMPNDVTSTYKQAKIDFDTWNWNSKGPYKVVVRAFDPAGALIATEILTLYIYN